MTVCGQVGCAPPSQVRSEPGVQPVLPHWPHPPCMALDTVPTVQRPWLQGSRQAGQVGTVVPLDPMGSQLGRESQQSEWGAWGLENREGQL